MGAVGPGDGHAGPPSKGTLGGEPTINAQLPTAYQAPPPTDGTAGGAGGSAARECGEPIRWPCSRRLGPTSFPSC